MNPLAAMKRTASTKLAERSLKKHRSKLGWQLAPKYQRYWDQCRAAFNGTLPDPGDIAAEIETFIADGVSSFWTPETGRIAQSMFDRIVTAEQAGTFGWTEETTDSGGHNFTGNLWQAFPELEGLFQGPDAPGPLGVLLSHYFGGYFKILYGTLYKSVGTHAPRSGSQLWHSDSGPGSCVNVMFYVSETTDDDGVLEALPWRDSLEIYLSEQAALKEKLHALGPNTEKIEVRKVRNAFYEEIIPGRYPDRVRRAYGPAGMVVPFLNNSLHRGGYPAAGRNRYAVVFHCYPSHKPTDYERYRRVGINKTVPYPPDPAADF